MRVKKINKTQEVKKYLLRYGAITKSVAISHFGDYDLPSTIRRIKNQSDGLKISVAPNSYPNTKYQIDDQS